MFLNIDAQQIDVMFGKREEKGIENKINKERKKESGGKINHFPIFSWEESEVKIKGKICSLMSL